MKPTVPTKMLYFLTSDSQGRVLLDNLPLVPRGVFISTAAPDYYPVAPGWQELGKDSVKFTTLPHLDMRVVIYGG